MPTRMVHMVIDAAEPARVARFWAAALGWEMTAGGPEVANVLPAGYSYPDPVAQLLVVLSVPEPKSAKNRVHLNLATRSAAHQAAEVDRLLSLGAVPADAGQGDVPWRVLADPEGNEFCVLDPRPAYRDTGPRSAPSVALLTGTNCANARTTSKSPSRCSFTPPLDGFARPLQHRREADLAKMHRRPLHSSMPSRTRVLVTHRVRRHRGARRTSPPFGAPRAGTVRLVVTVHKEYSVRS
jgi:hypothetical protein